MAAIEPVNPKAIVLARLTENEFPHIGRFNCGDEEMNKFLRDEAHTEQAMGMNSTVLLYYQGDLAAFCSVCCDAIPLSQAEREEERITVDYKAPAIKIARLGRDVNFKGIGLGQILIEYVKNMAYELSTTKVGVRFITADAYLERVDYYGRLGFIPNQAAHGRYFSNQKYESRHFWLVTTSLYFLPHLHPMPHMHPRSRISRQFSDSLGAEVLPNVYMCYQANS